MSLVFPTHLDPSAFCGVLAVVASGLPTRWGPNVLAAVSVSGLLSVVLIGLFASIVLSYVCRRHGSTESCLPSVSAGATCRVPVVDAGPTASECQLKPVRTPVAIFWSLGVCIYVPASRHWLISYSLIHLT